MVQTARSRSTHNTLRIKCARMVSLFCFFIYLSSLECSQFEFPCLKPEELFELLDKGSQPNLWSALNFRDFFRFSRDAILEKKSPCWISLLIVWCATPVNCL